MSRPTQEKTEDGSMIRSGYSINWTEIPERVLFIGGLAFMLFIFAFPIFWMVSSALRPQGELFTQGVRLFPESISLEHFKTLVLQTNFLQYYKNSIIVSAGVVFITTVLSTLGGYGLSRVNIPFKVVFARGVLLGYMFPSILLGIPMFIIWRQFGLLNSYIGLILAETALVLPFSLWLMWKFFQTVPESIEESAHVLGASRFGAFYDIALPMAKPGMMAVAIFSFAISWNAYTVPKILITDSDQWVLTIALDQLIRTEKVFWGQLMAGSFLMIIPGFLFVYFLQKYLLRGFRTGGMG